MSSKIKFTDQQLAIVRAQFKDDGLSRNFIVSTDAGTGKTTTIKLIVATARQLFADGSVWILVCAPTAQAARTSGDSFIDGKLIPAETIAWLVAKGDAANMVVWDKLQASAAVGKCKCIKIIADEFSMINYRDWVGLCARAFKAVEGTRCKVSVVVFGDVKQLPAIENGLLHTMLMKSSSQKPIGRNDVQMSKFQAGNFTLQSFLHRSEVKAFELTQGLRFLHEDGGDMQLLVRGLIQRNPNIVLPYMQCLQVSAHRPSPKPGLDNAVFLCYTNEQVQIINKQAAIFVGSARRIVYFLVEPKSKKVQTLLVESAPVVGIVNVRVPRSSDFLIANGEMAMCESVVGTEAQDVMPLAEDAYGVWNTCPIKRYLLINKELSIYVRKNADRSLVQLVPKKVDGENVVPVELAWSLTVHKEQGATIEPPTRLVINTARFNSRRLLYVAITRVRCIWQLFFVGVDPDNIVEMLAAEDDRASAAFLHRFKKLLYKQ